MTQRILCTGRVLPALTEVEVLPGVRLFLWPHESRQQVAAQVAAVLDEVEARPDLGVEPGPLCNIRPWLAAYRQAQRDGAAGDMACAAADVAVNGVRYAVGMAWDESPIVGSWQD